jgi:hypothetical protein
MAARRMMARITTTTQKKKMTMPGIAYPLMLRLATNASYPAPNDLFRYFLAPTAGGTVPGSADPVRVGNGREPVAGRTRS